MMKRFIEFVGIVAIIASILAASTLSWNAGWLQTLIPKERIAEPVSVSIHGPDETLAGREYVFVISAKGAAGTPVVKLLPDEPSAFTMIDPNTIKFQSPNPGQYVLAVSIGGDARQSDTSYKVFENLEAVSNESPPEPPQPPINIEALRALLMSTNQPKPPTVTQLAQSAIDGVHSSNKPEECRVVAGIFRSIINRIQTGLIPPEADPLSEIEDQIDLALGENARGWDSFTDGVRGIMGALRDQGAVVTAPTFVPALEEVAATLISNSSHSR